jgi:Endonuclease NucS C-terminal domain
MWRNAIAEKGWQGSTLEKVMFDWPLGKSTRYHPNPPAFDSIADEQKTVDEEDYRVLLGDLLRRGQRYSDLGSARNIQQSSEIEEVEKAIETTFGLERDLQAALRSNMEQLEPGLRITDGGKERSVESGRIDITAEDIDGATVVIELKAGEADRDAIGQILSYMGDLSQAGKPLRGILVAGSFSLRAVSASRAVKNLRLKKYSFRFSFDGIGD